MPTASIDVGRDEALARRIESAIQIVVGFPRDRIRFRDISPVIERDPALFRAAIDAMEGFHAADPPDGIVGVEAWGFVFAAPLAYRLGCRLVLARRADKLPRETIATSYDMSYAQGRGLALHRDALRAGERIVIVDDVVASGGTALAAASLVARAGARCVGVTCLAAFVDWGARLIAEQGISVNAVARL